MNGIKSPTTKDNGNVNRKVDKIDIIYAKNSVLFVANFLYKLTKQIFVYNIRSLISAVKWYVVCT